MLDYIVVPIGIAFAVLVQWLLLGFTPAFVTCIIAGYLAWTLAEYWVHRLLHDARSAQHRLHHDNPRGDAGVSSLHSLGIAFSLGTVLMGALGGPIGNGTFAGIMLGYLVFLIVHDRAHDPLAGWSILNGARRRHTLHHRGHAANYGVAHPLWDVLFGTYMGR